MRAAGPVVLGLMLLAMAGCGSSPSGAPAPGPTPTGTSTSTPSADEELQIVVRNASGTTSTWRLSCNPPGGTHPDPATACEVLGKVAATALPAVPSGRQCAQVYGGPETATISGSWQGRPVDSRLSRTNGCEISRWEALTGLLPPGG